jgi:hypothetical protein
MIAHRRWHRITFCLAGIYNILWGLYAVLDPQWLVRFASLPLQNHSQVFACRGMVIGLYGLLYLEVTRVPERGWLLAAVGLLGKLLGSAGLMVLIVSGQWPVATIVLCLTNDLIWWIPFTMYLKDASPSSTRRSRLILHATENALRRAQANTMFHKCRVNVY